MKLALFLLLALVACSGVDSGHDGGTTPDGSTNDSSSPSDASPQDGSNPSDAAADVVMGGDGGLNAGATCDPNNNQCKAGLLCCNEPTAANIVFTLSLLGIDQYLPDRAS